MKSYKMGDIVKNIFLVTLILYPFSVVRSSNQDVINGLEPYRLEIISEINVLVAHCRSKDTDFGEKILIINDAFHWEFRRNIGETTKYSCKLTWMADGKIFKEFDNFEVFNNHIAEECGKKLTKTNNCFWSISQAGFSFAKDNPSNWVLKQGW